MGVGTCTTKSVLFLLGLLFATCALLLWAVGGYVITSYHSYSHFVEARLTLVPAVVALAVGGVFFLAGLLGCCGTDNKCTLTLMVMFLGTLLVLMVGGAVAAQVYKGEIVHSVDSASQNVFAKFTHHNGTQPNELDKQVNWIQSHLQCCGVHTYADWTNESLGWAWEAEAAHHGKVPISCCALGPDCPKNATDIKPETILNSTLTVFGQGCLNKVSGVLDGRVQYVLGTLVGFAVLLVLGIVSACVLLCVQRQRNVPYFSLN